MNLEIDKTGSGKSIADEMDNSATIAKGLCIVVVFVTCAICGYLPFVLDRWFHLKNSAANSKTGIFLRTMLFFGGGCLICVTFQHIIVEASADISDLQFNDKLPATSFDLALFLMCIGFMIMFLIEELIHMYMNRHNRRVMNAAMEVGKTDDINGNIDVHVNDNHHDESHHGHQHGGIVDIHLPPTAIDASESLLMSSLRGLLIVLALSLHAFFEGMAIGLQPTADTAWYVTGAITGHKLVLAFCIGIELIATRVRLSLAFVYVFIFTIVAPIGIGIGMGISSGPSEVAASIINALAAGTLLYAAFFEILLKERSGLWTYGGFVAGFFVIYAIIVGTHKAEKPVYCSHAD